MIIMMIMIIMITMIIMIIIIMIMIIIIMIRHNNDTTANMSCNHVYSNDNDSTIIIKLIILMIT